MDGMASFFKDIFPDLPELMNWKGLFSIFLYACDNDHEIELFVLFDNHSTLSM